MRNCEQQRNTYDCGLFAMANEIALVHGFDPSTTFYSQTMRKQIFEMIEAGKLDQRIIAGQKNKESRHKFQKQETIGGVHKFVDIPERIIEILVMCHCQMPESFGNLLCCEKCLHQYHSCCYLISDDVAKALKTFVCYECREVGDYSFCETIYSTNMSSIANLVEIIKKKRDLKLGTFLPLVFAEPETRKVLISSLNQYQKFEKVMIEYDLNAVLSKGGSLYEAFLEICSTDSRRHKQFRKLNKAELMHFTVLTVCNLLDKDCEPLFSPGLPSGDRMSDNEAITFLKGNGNWIKKIKKELKQVTNKIDKQSAKKGKKKSFPDFLRTSKRNIEAAKRFAMDVLKITPGANLSSSTITKFEKLINESKNILISVEIYEKKLEDLENQYFE